MSKNRLLQIVNRLELNPKDKTDLINIINTNTDKVEKLLENVPEDLDTLKEIVNTPANFLNDNNELGGMINMPFGYNISQSFSKHIVSQTYKERILLCNLSGSYYYGNIAVAINNFITELKLSEIANKEIAVNNGYIYYDSNTHDVYFLTPPYPIDINVIIATFSDKKLLTKQFISLEIDWQNNNQEDSDSIKNRTHYISSKDEQYHNSQGINFNIIPDVDAYCYAYDNYNLSETILIKKDDTSYKTLNTATFTASIVRIGKNNSFFRTTVRGSDPNAVKFVIFTVKTLDDYYIPDTIARVADYELPHIKLDISETDSNVTTLNDNSVSLTDRCVCDLYNGYYDKENALIHNGELYNGVITGISKGNLIQYDVNFETGEITLKHEIDIAELYNKVNSL